MIPHIDIENLIILQSADAAKLPESLTSLAEALQESCDQVRATGEDRLRFHTSWEPPFKVLKDWSKARPEVTLTLLADAFAKHHWLLKATIQSGKSDELVVSRIDDEFDAIFKEVYGCSFAEWEKKQTAPFAGL